MVDVEPTHVITVDEPHPTGELAPRGLKQQMIMVRHQAKGVDLERAAFDQRADAIQEHPAVLVVEERAHPRHAARHDVVARAFEFDPRCSTHSLTHYAGDWVGSKEKLTVDTRSQAGHRSALRRYRARRDPAPVTLGRAGDVVLRRAAAGLDAH